MDTDEISDSCPSIGENPCHPWSIIPVIHSATVLPARDDAQQLDLIIRRERLCPLIGAKRGAIALDENSAISKTEFRHERSDIACSDFTRMAVQKNFHGARMAWSQSFHTASKPRPRSNSAISAGVRVSAI